MCQAKKELCSLVPCLNPEGIGILCVIWDSPATHTSAPGSPLPTADRPPPNPEMKFMGSCSHEWGKDDRNPEVFAFKCYKWGRTVRVVCAFEGSLRCWFHPKDAPIPQLRFYIVHRVQPKGFLAATSHCLTFPALHCFLGRGMPGPVLYSEQGSAGRDDPAH